MEICRVVKVYLKKWFAVKNESSSIVKSALFISIGRIAGKRLILFNF